MHRDSFPLLLYNETEFHFESTLTVLYVTVSCQVVVVNGTTAKISWSGLVSNNSHLGNCSFELQFVSKGTSYKTVYSGADKEFKLADLRPGMNYKFRYSTFTL